ncbi:hypothetical protein [Lacinutrix sp. Hel_I_90]|uniref:hypothetical protein n=1 Tax=Lacinutrix sp. Hel_I_90 TaxID=1249999 RepID=UPI000696B48B|nr:hypothetical protein [Lacinutrix sp. Hel_I_90]
MDKKNTTIKERILLIAKNKGISYEKFLSDLDLNYVNFKGKQKLTGINSNSIDRIVSDYPEIDLHWLITGEKKYENESKENTANEANKVYNKTEDIGKALELIIKKIVDKKFNEQFKPLDDKVEGVARSVIELAVKIGFEDKKKKQD